MKNLLLLCICILTAGKSFSQYYYTDILAAEQTDRQYKLLRSNLVQTVTAKSYESDNQQTQGFSIVQTISEDFKKIVTQTTYASGNSLTTSFYAGTKISKTQDSSAQVVTTTFYTYDNTGKIQSIKTETNDAFMSSHSEELHVWEYTADNKPARMLKIKDNNDTTFVQFKLDEQGNVGEESWRRKGRLMETYYYYYNDKHQLTDIVRYNFKAKKLLPDNLFEYDAKSRVTQMVQVPLGTSNYMTWKYTYNDQGLKQSEVCFNKQKQLVGRIEYSYKMVK